MTESVLTAKFLCEFRERSPSAVVIKHSDSITSGVPDISITLGGLTSWWEAKFAKPSCASKLVQELMLARLAATGFARYIVWCSRAGVDKTLIVHPRKVMERTSWDLEAEAWCLGFDMKWLVTEVLKAHQ